MAGVNKVILVGNLGDDPEARSLNNGGEVVNLRVATSENWKDRDGNRQERTEWHRVVIFNENLGRVAKQYLRKGSKVYLEGQIQTRKWTDQSGAGPLFDRGRAAALPRRARAARPARRRRRQRRRGLWRQLRRRRATSAAAAPAASRAKPQPAFDTDLDDDVPVLSRAGDRPGRRDDQSVLQLVPEPGERARTDPLPPRSSRPPPSALRRRSGARG